MTLRLRLAAYAPNGARRGILPTPQEFQASLPLGDQGALSLTYPLAGPKVAFLNGATEVALEVSHDLGQTWAEPDDARYLMLRRSGDPIQDQTWKREGPQYVWRLTKARVLPEGLLNEQGKRPFLSATAGTIIRTLAQEAQARGALAGMDFTTFSGTADSTGAAWNKIITIYYEPGTSLWQVLLNLSVQGVCDWAMRGRSLRLYVPETVQGGTSAAVLQRGRDLVEAPYRGTLENLTNYAYLAMDEGASLERTNPTAPSPWGRWETYISQGGVSDAGTAAVLSEAELERGSAERVENTYGLLFSPESPQPFRDYNLGQMLAVRESTATPASLRLRQITLTKDADGTVGGNVVLNDRFLEAEARIARRVTGITGGSSADGGTGARPIDKPLLDRKPPKAPGGVVVNSATYLDGAVRRAAATLSWVAVTENLDGTALDDLSHYIVYAQSSAVGAQMQALGETTGTTFSSSPYVTGSVWQFQVQAVDRDGNRSARSPITTHTMAVDTAPPTAPGTPTVSTRLGTITVAHPGTASTGGALEGDVALVEYHLSTSTGFTPSAATLVGTTPGPLAGRVVVTGRAYGTALFARTVAVDYAGNRSDPSATSASVTPQAIVAADLIGQVVSGANLIDASLDASTKVLAGSIDTTRLRVGQANLLVDSSFRDAALRTARDAASSTDWGFSSDPAHQRLTGGWVATMTSTGGNEFLELGAGTTDAATKAAIPVQPGQRLRFSAWVRVVAGWTGSFRPFLNTRGPDGTLATRNTTYAGAPFQPPSTTWTEYAWEVVIPDGVVAVDVGLYCSSTSSGTAYVSQPDLRLVVPGVLIQDGAITAGKIAALAVEADAIAANAITADKIAVGAVTAEKISTGVLDADLILAGRVTTAETGARVELNATGLYRYDATNTVRVAITESGATFTGTVQASTVTGSTVEASLIRTDDEGARVELTSGTLDKDGVHLFAGRDGETYTSRAGSIAFERAGRLFSRTFPSASGVADAKSRTILYGATGFTDGSTVIANDLRPEIRMTSGYQETADTVDLSRIDMLAHRTYTNGLAITSSRKVKDDIQPLAVDPSVLMDLRPVTWLPKGRTNPKERRVGFVAEDVQALGLTPLVALDAHGEPEALDYGGFTAYLALAVQDLSRRLAALEGPRRDTTARNAR